MHALVVAVLLNASPATLAALDLEPQQVPPAVAKLVGNHLAQRLTLKGFRVVTTADLAALLGVERQKMLLGCNEGTSCIAEIGSALNAKGVVLGTVGKLGETRLLNVKVVSSADAQALAVCSAKSSTDEGLLAEAERCADIIAAALIPAPAPPSAPAPPPASAPASALPPAPTSASAEAPRRTWALVPFIGGTVAAALGGAMLIVANIDADRFRTSTSGPALVFSQARNAADLGNGGLALIGGGAAVAVAGAVLYFARPAPVQPVVMLTPEGGFVGVSGVFR